MMQAIQAVHSKNQLQRCIVHQIRSSTKYVSYKDLKRVDVDLKRSIPLSRWKKPRKICVTSLNSSTNLLMCVKYKRREIQDKRQA